MAIVPTTIETDTQNRITTIYHSITTLVDTVNSLFTVLGIIINPQQLPVEQSSIVSKSKKPSITAKKPDDPIYDNQSVSPASPYSSGFSMPDVGNVTTDAVANGSLNWQEPEYTYWILPQMRDKILAGFNDLAITVKVETDIWNRQTARLISLRQDAVDRRDIRWSGMGVLDVAEDVNNRTSEVETNFDYIFADNVRDKDIKRAYLKDDNRKSSISMAFKGEQIYISRSEDVATRMLDIAETQVKLTIEAFKQEIAKYTEVTLPQWMNDLYAYVENLKIKIAQSRADVQRYTTNTRIISEANKMKAMQYDGKIDSFMADAMFNEVSGEINTEYNNLAINELEENLRIQVDAIRGDLENFIKKAEIERRFSGSIAASAAQYLSSSLHGISVLLSQYVQNEKDVTITTPTP